MENVTAQFLAESHEPSQSTKKDILSLVVIWVAISF